MTALKRFLPHSVSGQITLLVAVMMMIAQVISFFLMLQGRNRQYVTQISAPTIARLADAMERNANGVTSHFAEGTVAGHRGVFMDSRSRITPNMVPRPDIETRARDALDDFGINYTKLQAAEMDFPLPRTEDRYREVRRSLDPSAPTRRNSLMISVQIAPDRWITAVSRVPKRDPRIILWLLVQTVILYAVVLIPVLWIGRRIARPLASLTQAVDGFHNANSSIAVPESGPSDIRRLITSYNDMRTRIAALLDEKDRMLGAIGHDLRTPLASLRVRIEGMEDEAEREKMVTTISEMNQTLDDILSLARLGKPNEGATKVDLCALLDSVVDDFQALGANVTLQNCSRTTAHVRPTLIIRAVRNIVDNAVKYGGDASVSILSDSKGVSIIVEDHGPGIPADQIAHMFEPFTRMEISRSRETGGTGLGLALAKAIAELHDGELTLENRTEGGLRAVLWLPQTS